MRKAATTPLRCAGACRGCPSEPQCNTLSVLFPESPARAFRAVGAVLVRLGTESWQISAPTEVARLVRVFRGSSRWSAEPRRFIQDRLVASCSSPRRRRTLVLTCCGISDRDTGDAACLGRAEIAEASRTEWALVTAAVPSLARLYRLVPVAAAQTDRAAGRRARDAAGAPRLTLPAFRDLVDDMARGLATRTDRPGRPDLAAALRRAVASARRLREARTAVADLRETWMCSRSAPKARDGVRALSVLLRSIPA